MAVPIPEGKETSSPAARRQGTGHNDPPTPAHPRVACHLGEMRVGGEETRPKGHFLATTICILISDGRENASLQRNLWRPEKIIIAARYAARRFLSQPPLRPAASRLITHRVGRNLSSAEGGWG